eukprot:jgi/Undpi1/6726/HiC_scaffold_20.g09205.m1
MVISSTDKDVNDVNNDVGQALSAGDDGTNGDIAIKPRAAGVRRATQAKQKLSSAVVGASQRHVFDSEIFALALPTLGAVLIDPCLSLMDTGYVGRLGALSLAAIGPCTAAFNVVSITASCAFLVTTSVFVSASRTLDDRKAIGRTTTLASGLAVTLGVAMTAAFCYRAEGVLSLMGAPSAVMGLAVPYLRWRALGFPANLFLLAACGTFRGMGDPKVSLVNAMVVGAVNLVLDPLLMFGFGLGVTGAAMATAAAQWMGALVYIRYMWVRREKLGLAEGLQLPRWLEVTKFVGAGSAMVFRQMCNVGAWTVMASAASRMGILEIAAHQLILSLWIVIAYVQEALGMAGQVLVSQSLELAKTSQKTLGLGRRAAWGGEALKHRETARSIAKRVLTLSFGLGISLAVSSRTLFPPLLSVVCPSTEVAQLVAKTFPVILYAFPMCCVVWTWDALFYGASDFVYNAKTVAVASFFGVSGSVLSLQRGWGIQGLWISMTYVLFGVRLAAHLWRFNSSKGPFGPSAFWDETAPQNDGVTIDRTDEVLLSAA